VLKFFDSRREDRRFCTEWNHGASVWIYQIQTSILTEMIFFTQGTPSNLVESWSCQPHNHDYVLDTFQRTESTEYRTDCKDRISCACDRTGSIIPFR
jgi:hypothetical protein